VVIGASAVTAACGAVHAGAGGSPGSQPSGQASGVSCSATPAAPTHSLKLGKSDNGQVLCVAKGTTVAIFLQGTAARRWAPIHTASAALKPVPNGQLMLKLGETGAFFKAVSPGVATVLSSLPSCPGQGTGNGGSSGPACKMGTVFHLTLVVTG
jgi:hypothetical protein